LALAYFFWATTYFKTQLHIDMIINTLTVDTVFTANSPKAEAQNEN